jgi:hypothetical protein
MLIGVVAALATALAGEEKPSPLVTWEVEPGMVCPSQSQLRSALTSYVSSLPISDRPKKGEPARVQLAKRPPRSIRLRLSKSKPTVVLERVIASNGRCEDLAQTVAILITNWLMAMPESAAAVPVAAGAPPIEEVRELRPPESTAPASPASSSTGLSTELSPLAHGHPPPALSVRPSFGIIASEGAPAAPVVSMVLDLRLSRLVAVGASAAWLGNLSAADGSYGSILVHRQLFGVYAMFSLLPVDRWLRGIATSGLFVEPLLSNAMAQSYGYPITRHQELFSLGVEGGLQLGRQLIGPLQAVLHAGLITFANSTRYAVTRPDGSAVDLAGLGSIAFDLQLGLGAQIF